MCVTVRQIDKKLTSDNLFKVSGKTNEATEKKHILLSLLKTSNKLPRNKIKIKTTTAFSNLPTKAIETVKRDASCAFIANFEQFITLLKIKTIVKRLKTIKTKLKIICMLLVELN